MTSRGLERTWICTGGYGRFRGEWVNLRFMHQSIPAAPSPCLGYCGAFSHLVSPKGGAFANFALPGGQAFCNPRAIPKLSYQNITTQRILLEKQAYWLNCQEQEKIEEGCKDMLSILCIHFFTTSFPGFFPTHPYGVRDRETLVGSGHVAPEQN